MEGLYYGAFILSRVRIIRGSYHRVLVLSKFYCVSSDHSLRLCHKEAPFCSSIEGHISSSTWNALGIVQEIIALKCLVSRESQVDGKNLKNLISEGSFQRVDEKVFQIHRYIFF